jgi:hypothetical protein
LSDKIENVVYNEKTLVVLPVVVEFAFAVLGRGGHPCPKTKKAKVSGMTRMVDPDLHGKDRGRPSIFNNQHVHHLSDTV